MNCLQNRNGSTNIEIRLTVAKREGRGREMDWACGVGRCTLLHWEWINAKVLLYSAGNYIQYPVIMENRKRMQNRICVKLSYFAVQWILAQPYKSTILQSKKSDRRNQQNIVKQLSSNLKKKVDLRVIMMISWVGWIGKRRNRMTRRDFKMPLRFLPWDIGCSALHLPR